MSKSSSESANRIQRDGSSNDSSKREEETQNSWFCGMHAIPEDALDHLEEHKYTAGAKTPLDVILDYYWEFVSNYIPSVRAKATGCTKSCAARYDVLGYLYTQFMSPNMVTFVGLFVVLVPVVYAVLQTGGDRNNIGVLQDEFYIYAALALFIYNTMDAIDGKHARKTKQSSPLGQIVDHGKHW